jgi:hypothetical protein
MGSAKYYEKVHLFRRVLLVPGQLQSGRTEALIQAATAGATRQRRAAPVFKLEAAQGATEDESKGGSFAALAPPFVEQPGGEDRPEHDAQVDEDQITEANGNHGVRVATL